MTILVLITNNSINAQNNYVPNGSFEQPCIITLSNALPQEVFKQEINALKGKNNLTIPTAGLSDGVYFLTVKFKDKTLSQKVMIIK